MRVNQDHNEKKEYRERLGLLGLAADRGEGAGPCPDDDDFASLLEAVPGSATQRSFYRHLSGCDACMQKWLALSEEVRPGRLQRSGRRLTAVAGSVCAVAAVVLLFLSIDYQSVERGRGDSEPARVAVPSAADDAPRPEPAPEAARRLAEKPFSAPGASDGAAVRDADKSLEEEAETGRTAPAARVDLKATAGRQEAAAPPLERGDAEMGPAAEAKIAPQLRTDAESARSAEHAIAIVDLVLAACRAQPGNNQRELLRAAAARGRELRAGEAALDEETRRFLDELAALEHQDPLTGERLTRLCARAAGLGQKDR